MGAGALIAVAAFLAGLAVSRGTKSSAKNSRDYWFDRWVELKSELSNLERHMRDLYVYLKNSRISRNEREQGHLYLKQLKQESARLRASKQQTHEQWKYHRTELLR